MINNFLNKYGKEKVIYFTLYILFGVVGIVKSIVDFSTNPVGPMGFFFGMIFFVAGIYACTSRGSKVIGILFLFTHGGVGYGVMIGSLLANLYDSPIITDLGNNSNNYFIIFQTLIILAVIGFIIFNLSDKVKDKYKYPIIPVALMLAATIIAVIFPYSIVPHFDGIFY